MIDLRVGDCRDVLKLLADGSVQCCVTSPPYFGLRDYGVAGQIGLETSPDAYVAEMVAVFREVRRVLRDDGTLWLNLGDSFVGGGGFWASSPSNLAGSKQTTQRGAKPGSIRAGHGLKNKDLIGTPWRVAFALQADGWFLRSDIIWAKPNPMPESVRDRPTRSHEYVFLLTKSARYYYDAAAIAENAVEAGRASGNKARVLPDEYGKPNSGLGHSIPWTDSDGTRNARSVWTIGTQPFPEAHFATFPAELAERCIKAGSRPLVDTVLDPFAGAGTALLAADRLQRHGIGIELNTEYAAMARRRLTRDAPLLAEVS